MSELNPEHKTLLIGIGNDGRGDDALGWLFADQFSDKGLMDVAYRYQLQIEDAERIRAYERVLFVDASVSDLENGFSLQSCLPLPSLHFSTHRIEPATILWLAQEVYNANLQGYVLAIQGYNWDLQLGLSPAASQNFEKALDHFRREFKLP